ncbi:MAG: HAMP domain-containing protein [Lachnospiraceae bacterium]|nr:HAMP domain-containing protein [Lachnospiraceae bacterium]
MKLRTKIIFTALMPLLALSIIFCSAAYGVMRTVAISEANNGLHSTALSVRQYLYNLNDDPYGIGGDDKLYKGTFCITDATSYVDSIYNESNIKITVFYENVRYLTSLKDANGERLLYTASSDEVYEAVVKQNQTYYSSNMNLGGSKHLVCYIPYAYNNQTVGMVFVGVESDVALEAVNKYTIILVAVTIIIDIIAFLVIFFVSNSILKRIRQSINTVEILSNGDLTVRVKKSALNAKDETGDITRAVVKLRDTLNTIVTNIVGHSDALKAESDTLSANAVRTIESVGQVEMAMGEIATGASSQAEETQHATTSVIEMGELIENTVEATHMLTELSNKMLAASEEVTETLENLEEINNQAQAAIDEIYVQTNTTNESALKIQQATELITAIADETTLLSLNASIEAARAGEAGRGFAVVASEIQKLAEQSNESANQINNIIKDLITDSTTAVETMENVKSIMKVQSDSVSKTNLLFNEMKENMNDSVSAINEISVQTNEIDDARTVVVDAVQNLSAIAEENAASAQQTSASILEVNEMTQYIGERAERLDDVSTELAEAMGFFTIKKKK